MVGELQQALGLSLRRRRESMGLSQEAMADELGFHRTYMGSLERGERNLSLRALEELAEKLRVDPLDLLVRE